MRAGVEQGQARGAIAQMHGAVAGVRKTLEAKQTQLAAGRQQRPAAPPACDPRVQQ